MPKADDSQFDFLIDVIKAIEAYKPAGPSQKFISVPASARRPNVGFPGKPQALKPAVVEPERPAEPASLPQIAKQIQLKSSTPGIRRSHRIFPVGAPDIRPESARGPYGRGSEAPTVQGWLAGPFLVSSSWVRSIGMYALRGETGIAVGYKSGAVCFYPTTGVNTFKGMESAPSKGGFVHQTLFNLPYVIVA